MACIAENMYCFAHHLVGMHTHLQAPDWRTLSGGHAAALGRPAFAHNAAPFFHHQHAAAFSVHSLGSSTLDRPNLTRLNESHPHLSQINQLSSVAAHSTTSPEGSPTTISVGLGQSATLTTSPPLTTTNSDNENNNIDAGFESDSISVTGSPRKSSSVNEDDDGRSSSPPSSNTGNGGAFTSLIQRNNSLRKNDFFSGFATNFPPATPSFNPALAAQLFLQNPLLPQPSQWLYTQLYSNYNDFPWFRNINPVNPAQTSALLAPTSLESTTPSTSLAGVNSPPVDSLHGVNLIKRCVTLISHNTNDSESNSVPPTTISPAPVTSTRRSPSPVETIDLDDVSTTSKSGSSTYGPIRCRTPKTTDVWRPY
uniref:Uncharacterized protein n=1 Tax=Glossina pallidipes TaxID=7398 RepID=A0A1A9ZRJ4_GLOPL